MSKTPTLADLRTRQEAIELHLLATIQELERTYQVQVGQISLNHEELVGNRMPTTTEVALTVYV